MIGCCRCEWAEAGASKRLLLRRRRRRVAVGVFMVRMINGCDPSEKRE